MISDIAFKEGMALWPTGVMVMTVGDNGREEKNPVAVTINSWTSASLKPPLVSFYLKQSAWCASVFEHCTFFGAHLLSASQQPIAQRYATPGGQSWIHGQDHHPQSSPLLLQCLVSLECEHVHTLQVGDHNLIVGQVCSIQPPTLGIPLVYWGRQYQSDVSFMTREQAVLASVDAPITKDPVDRESTSPESD